MNKLLLALLLTSSTAFAGGSIAEQNERNRIQAQETMRQTQEWAYQQNMQQLQQEQNRILQQQADDYYFNNLRNNRNTARNNCNSYYC